MSLQLSIVFPATRWLFIFWSLWAQPSQAINTSNVIDRTGNPKQHKEYDKYQNQRFNPLFDLGAWHGFLLPEQTSDEATFTGPMIIAQEYSLFIAEKLEELSITNISDNQKLDFAKAKITRLSTPGQLQQSFVFEKLTLELRLNFISDRTALIETKIINHSDDNLSLLLTWQGELLSQWDDKNTVKAALPNWQTHLTADSKGVTFQFSEVRNTWNILTSNSAQYHINRSIPAITTINQAQLNYQSNVKINVAKASTQRIFTTQSYFHNQSEADAQQAFINEALLISG